MKPEQFEHAEELFEQVCDMTPADRVAYLSEHCADDPVVRTEVERLLEIDGVINEPATADAGSVSTPTTDIAPAALDRIGRYRIIRVCGRGGMGTVYEAEQDTPHRRVALKLIRFGAMSRSALRRFRQESEILGRLQHAGIAQIYEAGTYDVGEGGQPYFAMEFVDGTPLYTYARKRGLDTRERLLLFTRICDAVQHAHQKGIIHRDLKPDNVLVVPPQTADGSSSGTSSYDEAAAIGRPKILDFGLARITDADVQLSTLQTDVGQLIGTVKYMSPEQAAGDARQLDTRSDVYSLGVMLYELLADRPPYDLSHRSIPDAIVVIRERAPHRLSAINASLGGDIETIVGKALEKDPDRRYQSASDLAADIHRSLRNEPISARSPSAWYQARKFAQRNRTLVGGVVTTLAVLVAGVVVATALAIRSEANAAEARRESYRAGIAAASAIMLEDPGTAARYLEATPSELRGWEWRHLNSRLDPHVLSYRAAAKPGSHIAYTSDGEHLLATLVDGTVAVWKARDATLVRTISADASVTALAVPATGPARLALGTADGRLIMCGVDGGDRVELRLNDDGVQHLAWNKEGSHLAVISGERLVLWQDGQALRELEQLRFRSVLAFSPDGTRLAGLADGRLSNRPLIWDVASGEHVAVGGLAKHYPTSFAYSHDGTRLLMGTAFRLIADVDAELLEVSGWFAGHRASVRAVASSTTGDLASSSEDGTIRLWRDGANAGVLNVGHATPIAFTPDGAGLAYNAGDEIRLWDLAGGAATVFDRHTSYVYHVDFSPDGLLLASGTYPGAEAYVWDTLDGHHIASMDMSGRDAAYMGFTADGLLRVNDELFDPTTGARRATVERAGAFRTPGHRTETWKRIAPAYVWSDDGTLLALGSRYVAAAGPISVTEATGAVRLELAGDYWGAAFSPDTAQLAATTESGLVEIWDLATGDLLVELTGHAAYGSAYCVAFHPDGTRLASGGNDGTIRLWDTITWQQVHEMRGHTSYVKSLAFSPDGTQLASGSGDFTVRLWDTLSRAQRARQSNERRQGLGRSRENPH